MKKHPDFSYVNKNGKLVAGAAAFMHHVFTECGGVSKYNDRVGLEYLKEFIKTFSPKINKTISREAKKNRFKRVG